MGAGLALDTDRYFFISSNVLGGCKGTTGPSSVNPQTGKPYGSQFPNIVVQDIVKVQKALLDHLGISHLKLLLADLLAACKRINGRLIILILWIIS